ncbi:MAG TPA: hypothetical protein VHF70_10995, partial [Rubrobacteraceae bacterium]|nr:hypothetical protein [Rubrobacteraceae bacterium]
SLGTDNFGVSGSAYVDKLTKVAQYLGRKGFLKRQTINWSMFSVTREGIEEAERGVSQAPASTGQGPRDQRRRYLGAIYAITGGNPTQYVSWPEVAPWMGWDRDDQDSFEKGLQIARSLAHSGFITIESDAGSEYRITDEGLAEVEADPSITMPPDILATPDEFSDAAPVGEAPVEIQESLYRFKGDHPDPARVAFIMMEFGQTKAHTAITEAVRSGLDEAGIEGVRADDKRYHDHLFYNVLTYLHGCGLGMAIYERIEAETYNPNVALEVGYLFAMRKPVCLLKDQTLTTLPADLVGRLYDPFDPQDPAGTIPPLVSKWLSDKGLV